MVRRTCRVVARVTVGVVLVLTALVVVVALRLMSGPVDLDFLKPRIAKLIDVPGNDIHPDFDKIFFEWSGISRPVRLAFTNLRFTNEKEQVIARVPEASLTFEPRAIVQGMLLPTSITITRPVIEADIARDGGVFQRIFTSQEEGSQGEAVSILVDQLLAEPNYKSLIGQLDSVLVEHANVTVRDLKSGLAWMAPDASAQLRRDAAGVFITADARFTGHGDPLDLSLAGVYTRDRSRISVEAKVSGFKPWILADLSPDLSILRGVDIMLSGRLQIEGTGKGELRTVGVDITGANGSVTLPGILPVAHQVRAMNGRFSIDNVEHTSKIERADFDFGAARVVITGAGHRVSETRHFAGRAEIRQIPVDKLGDYWPLDFAEGGRRWSIANVTAGSVDVAAEFAASAPVENIADIKIDRMAAFLDYGGLTVRYMPDMPEMQDVSGKARYENGNLHFDIARGGAVNLKVTDGTIDLTGLDKPSPQMAAIRLPISGSAQDVMRFLARPKLGLPRESLFDSRRLGGQAAVDVSLSFPLIDALTVAEIQVGADAQLTAFSLKDVMGEVDLTDASARVKYSGSELSVTGQGKLDGSVVDVTWREMFGAKVPFRRRYDVKGTVPATIVEKAGFPSIEPYVVGPVGTALQYQVATNGTGEVTGRFDMKAAKLNVMPLAWSKEAGAEALATMTLKLAGGGKITTADFDARGGGLQARGQVRFADGAVQQISLQQIKLGQTDVAVDWRRHPGGVDLAIKGQSIELQRVRDMLHARNEVATREPKGAASVSRTSTRAQIQLQNIVLKRGALGYLNGRLELIGDRVASADLTMGGGKGSTFRVTPSGQGRTLFFYVADFGQLLSEAGWIDGLVNGYLHIEGKFNDTWADPPLDGTLKMGPYRLQRVTPRRDIGTLNAAIDGLNAAGNALQQFDSLSANLVKAGDRIQVRNGRTSGQSIGLTTQGVIDLGNDTAQLNGIVVPAFALNNMLSNVPLLGPLLTGGKDGGMFAVSYQLHGPFADLKADVNMMSAMAPGALRDLFTSSPGSGTAPSGQSVGSPEGQRAP